MRFNQIKITFVFIYCFCWHAKAQNNTETQLFFWQGSSFNTRLFYNNTDTLLALGNYLPDTKIKNGKWVYFYKNGNVSREIYFHNDMKRGIWTYYNEEGMLIKKEKWSERQMFFDETIFGKLAEIINAFAQTRSEHQRSVFRQQQQKAKHAYKYYPAQ